MTRLWCSPSRLTQKLLGASQSREGVGSGPLRASDPQRSSGNPGHPAQGPPLGAAQGAGLRSGEKAGVGSSNLLPLYKLFFKKSHNSVQRVEKWVGGPPEKREVFIWGDLKALMLMCPPVFSSFLPVGYG